ncbi:MAG: TlpA disulfide reductase family protein [Acidobacteriota bacterium]
MVAFKPIDWDLELADADQAGNLYFEERDVGGGVTALDVYGLGPKRDEARQTLVPAVTGMTNRRAESPVPAPEFSVTDLEGNEFSLENLRGRVVLVTFWSIGCSPCRAEVPRLNALAEEFKGLPVTFLAPTPDGAKALQQFLSTTDFRFRVINYAGTDLADRFGVHGSIPVHFLIDKKGNVDSVINGAVVNDERLGRRVRQLLDR